MVCSGRLRFRSLLPEAETWEGAGEGVDVLGAAAVRLLESLVDDEVRLDLKALIWLSRYDMLTGREDLERLFFSIKMGPSCSISTPVDVECHVLPHLRTSWRSDN